MKTVQRLLLVGGSLFVLLGAGQPTVPFQPGEWETTTTVTSATLPGVPAFIADMLMKPKTGRRCIDARTAAQGPAQAMVTKGCTAVDPRSSATGFSVDLVCGRMRTHIEARATPITLEGTGETTKTDSSLDVRARFTAHRVGACA